MYLLDKESVPWRGEHEIPKILPKKEEFRNLHPTQVPKIFRGVHIMLCYVSKLEFKQDPDY